MTDQEKFEQWANDYALYAEPLTNLGRHADCKAAYLAAKQVSAAEIAELKEVMREVIRISDRKHDAWDSAKELLKEGEGRVLTRAALANVIENQATTIAQLKADNARLREALELAIGAIELELPDNFKEDEYPISSTALVTCKQALASTPAQSLQDHDET